MKQVNSLDAVLDSPPHDLLSRLDALRKKEREVKNHIGIIESILEFQNIDIPANPKYTSRRRKNK